MKISDMIQRSDTGAGRAFDYAVLSLVAVSVVLLFAEGIPGLPDAATNILGRFQTIIIVLFTMEYVLRVVTAPRKRNYIFSFYGIVDLLSIAPSYLSLWTGAGTGMDADFAVVRALRFLRIFRIMKIGRYNKAFGRFGKAFSAAKEELFVFLIVVSILVCITGVAVYHFENTAQPEKFGSVLDGLWWAVATLTTVGHEEINPITPWGKLFSSIVVLCSLGIVAAPSGIIAAALTKVLRDEDQ